MNEDERLFRIVGAVMVQEARINLEFFDKLKRALQLLVQDERDRQFLRRIGWFEDE
jgi:hypothetical protein